jgi:hypothetical protein
VTRIILDLDPDGVLWLYQDSGETAQVELWAGNARKPRQMVPTGVKQAVGQVLPDDQPLTLHAPRYRPAGPMETPLPWPARGSGK